jgi:hypothetical protein
MGMFLDAGMAGVISLPNVPAQVYGWEVDKRARQVRAI